MDYTTLIAGKSTTGSLASWVNSNAIPSADIIGDAESWVYERLRVPQMVKTDTSLVFTVGQNAIALPSDFIAPAAFWITGEDKQPLEQKIAADLIAKVSYDSSGAIMQEKPRYFYFDADNFVFDTKADAAYATWLVYWKFPAALGPSNTTNFLTQRYSRMFRLALRGIAFEWLKDGSQQAAAALELAAEHIERINMEAGMAMFANANIPVLR